MYKKQKTIIAYYISIFKIKNPSIIFIEGFLFKHQSKNYFFLQQPYGRLLRGHARISPCGAGRFSQFTRFALKPSRY